MKINRCSDTSSSSGAPRSGRFSTSAGGCPRQSGAQSMRCLLPCLQQQVEAVANASGDPSAVSPVSVERCTCAVLLGDTRSALQLLGMAGGSLYPIDAEVSAFVQVGPCGAWALGGVRAETHPLPPPEVGVCATIRYAAWAVAHPSPFRGSCWGQWNAADGCRASPWGF